MKRPHRAAFSLMEVVMAVGILLASAIVLAELAGVGRDHANAAEELAAAQLAAQTKLNEILVSATPANAVQDAPLETPAGWIYSVEIEPLVRDGLPSGLAALHVTVAQDVSDDRPRDRPGRQFTLTRWIRDPGASDATGSLPDDLLAWPFEEDLP